jgi:uncharacterized protein (TIGR01777 family)
VKIVLPGGTGHVGRMLSRELRAAGHQVVVLSRGAGDVRWDGRNLGPWAREVDGADAVVNLAGRSVSCRYTARNRREMMDSRIDSTTVVGEAIERAERPPRVWLQMSTATIYAHTFGRANDEASGVIGGGEPGVPGYWEHSVRIARDWEQAQAAATTPATRKVALRTAIVMSPDRGGAFDVLRRMARYGLGGAVAGGRQYVSWIHERDFARAVAFLLDREDLAGPVNLAAPNPLPHKEFMRTMRAACGAPAGLPATRWMAELGALALRTDTELLLKSRRVVPGRLRDAGFRFDFPSWSEAAFDLVART